MPCPLPPAGLGDQVKDPPTPVHRHGKLPPSAPRRSEAMLGTQGLTGLDSAYPSAAGVTLGPQLQQLLGPERIQQVCVHEPAGRVVCPNV